jgi:hypothetical protein
MNNENEYNRESFLKTFIKGLKETTSKTNPNPNNNHNNNNDNNNDELKVIYNDIHTAYALMKKTKKLRSDIKKKEEMSKPEMYDSHFLPKEINEYIIKNTKYQLTYYDDINDIKIHFALFSENELEHLDNYIEQAEVIILWLYICRMYSAKTCANKIKIYIYPTPFNKKLPKSNIDILSAEHVNTAYTYDCPKDAEIIIFRNEEWFKVFLHESFHTYGLDFSNIKNNKNTGLYNQLKSIFPIESEFNVTEAYAETWARIMNCAICVFYALIKKNKKDEKKFIEYMHSSLELESSFSIFQCNKILKFMGMEYKDLYEKKEESSILKRQLYKEKTNVFAYYIITSILMNDIDGFLKWCSGHNLSLLQFNNKSQQALKEFGEYIEKEYKNEKMNECLKEMNELYLNSSKSNKNKMNNILLETTRMTLFG